MVFGPVYENNNDCPGNRLKTATPITGRTSSSTFFFVFFSFFVFFVSIIEDRKALVAYRSSKHILYCILYLHDHSCRGREFINTKPPPRRKTAPSHITDMYFFSVFRFFSSLSMSTTSRNRLTAPRRRPRDVRPSGLLVFYRFSGHRILSSVSLVFYPIRGFHGTRDRPDRSRLTSVFHLRAEQCRL